MKPLSDVEPRVAVSASNTPGDATAKYVITKPGSYYLTAGLVGEAGKGGIDIAASQVTLDLCGFDLAGVTGSLNGVHVRGSQRGVVIRNGSVRGWPDIGIDISDAPFSAVEDVRASSNGVGIVAATRCTVRRCVAEDNEGGGILTGQGCSVSDCTSSFNRRYGIYVLEASRVTSCTVEGNTNHGMYLDGDGCLVAGCVAVANQLHGIASIYSSTMERCVSEHNGGDGLWSLGATTFSECRSSFNSGDGIDAGDLSTVVQCVARGNSQEGLRIGSRVAVSGNHVADHRKAAGILAVGQSARIENNTLTGNDVGVRAESTGNFIVRNTASASLTRAFDIVEGNTFGPMLTVTGAGDMSNVPGTEHPQANFIY